MSSHSYPLSTPQTLHNSPTRKILSILWDLFQTPSPYLSHSSTSLVRKTLNDPKEEMLSASSYGSSSEPFLGKFSLLTLNYKSFEYIIIPVIL